MPSVVDQAAAVLSGFACFSMASEHGVDVARQRLVAIENAFAHFVIPAFAAQPFELVMEIEHERGVRETSCRARGLWMEPHNEERLATEAKGKMGVGRIGTDPVIVRLAARLGTTFNQIKNIRRW